RSSKQEVGLGHFEGRGWRGFHHHVTLCIAAYGFLISERARIHPQHLVPPGRSRNLAHPTRPDTTLPTPRNRRCDPNATSQTRSPPCASSWLSSERSRDAHAAQLPSPDDHDREICDTV